MQAEELFGRSARSQGCLSGWRLSRLALDLLPDEERSRARAHLEECQPCEVRWRHERAAQAVAETLDVSPLLNRLSQRKTARRRLVGVAFSAVAMAAVLLLVAGPLPRPPLDATRSKGPSEVLFTVVRRGHVVLDLQPASAVRDLRPGDGVRVSVVGGRGWVRLEGWEDGRWVLYYEGRVPPGGKLPVGARVTDVGRTRVRVVTCNAAPASRTVLPRGCAEQVVEGP